MLGLALLILIGLWLALSVGAGAIAYRLTRRRWAQVVVTLLLLWLPFWDVIVGVRAFDDYKNLAGVRIDRRVNVDGYFDSTITTSEDGVSRLRWSRYEYLEVQERQSDPIDHPLTPTPGYYQFRLVPQGSRDCEAFEAMPQAARIRKNYGLDGLCVVVTSSDKPVSQYRFGVDKTSYYGALRFVYPVEVSCMKVVDLTSSIAIAQQCQVGWRSWLARKWYFGIPSWGASWHDNGAQKPLRLEDVLLPPNV